MPDATIIDASKQIIDFGIIGSVLILVIAAASWVVRQWMKTLRELYAEKDARLRDAKEHASLAESMRNAMAANTTAIQAVLGYLK